jgi:GNAT superfamily N-acetyltransferase
MKVKNKTVQQPLFKKLFPSVLVSTTGKAQIQNDELNIIKIKTINVDQLEFRFAVKLAEKKKWMDRFRKAYRGLLHPLSLALFEPVNKYLIASIDGTDVGFLRIVDHQEGFASVTDKPIWNISDGYVKPAYQSQGILRAMIQHAIAKCHAKSLTLANERFEKCEPYYNALGFSVVAYDENIRCYLLYLAEWEVFLAQVAPRVKV